MMFYIELYSIHFNIAFCCFNLHNLLIYSASVSVIYLYWKIQSAFIYFYPCKLPHLEMPNNLLIHHTYDGTFVIPRFFNLNFIIINHDKITTVECISSFIECSISIFWLVTRIKLCLRCHILVIIMWIFSHFNISKTGTHLKIDDILQSL